MIAAGLLYQDINFWDIKCVDVAEGEVPWGGVDGIGTVGSFYVSVSGRPGPEGVGSLELANITLGAQSNMLYETE